MDTVLDRSVLHWLHRASQVAEEAFAREQGSPALTPRQYIVLAAISSREGQKQNEIAQIAGVDRSTMADVSHRLEAAGYVTRERRRVDARSYSMKLTPKGRRALDEARAAATRVESRLLEVLPQSDRAQLIPVLRALVEGKSSGIFLYELHQGFKKSETDLP